MNDEDSSASDDRPAPESPQPDPSDPQAPSKFAHVELLVAERVEESDHLEFKQQLPEAGHSDPIAKAIASFANSDGGTLIYGIEEDDEGRAAALHPITLAGAPERIELVARQALDGPLTVQTSSVTSPSDAALGFVIVRIPRSPRAPHFHKGTAWGRSSRTVTPLTRHQIGELFARQPGFAEEFHLLPDRPGRVQVSLTSEPAQGRSAYDYYLLFQNDGDSDVFNVTYETLNAGNICLRDEGVFPVDIMPPGNRFRVRLRHFSHPSAAFRIDTHWRDARGQEDSASWPIGH